MVSKQDDRREEVKWRKSLMSSGAKSKKALSGTGTVFASVKKNMRFWLHLSVANLTLRRRCGRGRTWFRGEDVEKIILRRARVPHHKHRSNITTSEL
jgi:hypothetical protein